MSKLSLAEERLEQGDYRGNHGRRKMCRRRRTRFCPGLPVVDLVAFLRFAMHALCGRRVGDTFG